MELESLKRQLAYLDKGNVNIEKLVTDRHSQVSAYMAQEKPTIRHAYDVWHLAKGINTLLYCSYYQCVLIIISVLIIVLIIFHAKSSVRVLTKLVLHIHFYFTTNFQEKRRNC